MSLSIYEISVPVFVRKLGVLSRLLAKGEAHAAASGMAPAEILEAKLAPNMYNLIRQVQTACDAAKFGAARLAGITPPSHPDTETSFAELQARIKSVLDFLNGLDQAAFEGAENKPVALKTGSGDLSFDGKGYLLTFALPHFYFHIVTAYDILRHKGVELVKGNYLGLKD